MPSNRKIVRLEESRGELEHLQRELDAWLEHRRSRDRQGQYKTQLRHFESVLHAGLGRVREELDRIEDERDCGRVYERCRESDQRVAFLRRFWSWFRTKWDQRDDPAFEKVLRAAEEVVWSCYVEPFRRAGVDVGPAPLPYVDPHFSAHATTRRQVPASIKTIDDLFESMLGELPVPVVGIPPVCARRPWWLAVLAHEAGHQVEGDLGGRGIASEVQSVVQSAGDPGGTDRAWTRWAPEIFADAFAAAAVGPAYDWVLSELEFATPTVMLTNSTPYPPRVVRRELVARILAALELDPGQAVPQFGSPAPAQLGSNGAASDALRRQLASASAVAGALARDRLGSVDPLPGLLDWDPAVFSRDGRIDRWRGRWLSDQRVAPETNVRSAREAIAGAVAAWCEVARIRSDALRRRATARLCDRVLEVLPECREEGTRAAAPPPVSVDDLGERFAAELLQVELPEA